MKDIKTIIAENLISLRKQHKLTQNELAEKLNYSDNTVSRWEKAEITPSIETLEQISKVYGVDIEYLLKENIVQKMDDNTKTLKIKKLSTILLCVSLVWFVSTIAYIYLKTIYHTNNWIIFIWAIPLSCLVLLAFNKYVSNRVYSFVFSTILIWTFITSFYLHFLKYNLFLVFFIGIPAQFALSIYTFVRPKNIITKNNWYFYQLFFIKIKFSS